MWNTCTYKTLIRDIKDEINGEIYFYLRFWRLNNGKMSISSDKFIDFYTVLFKITVIFRNLQTDSKIWKCIKLKYLKYTWKIRIKPDDSYLVISRFIIKLQYWGQYNINRQIDK